MTWKPLATVDVARVHEGGFGMPANAGDSELGGSPRDESVLDDPLAGVPSYMLDSAEFDGLQLAGATLDPTAHPAGETPGAGTARRAAPTPGQQFGRYRIVSQLGQGGMGVVLKALDTRLERDVALKIPTGGSADEHARFYREATAMARFRHPNVCPIHDCGDVDGLPYIAMAFIDGQSLRAIADGKPMPQGTAVQYVLEIARALAEAHREGIVHRDLKPENVMIDRDGNPIVMDFGLARKLLDNDPRLTMDGTTLGTPQYMSPEQAGGNVDAIGPPSDVYSLGTLFYELLTGKVPFNGNLATILRRIREERPERPSALRPDVDPRIEGLCLRMMARRIDDRPASSTVVNQLTKWLADSETPGTAPAGEGPRTTVDVPLPSMLPSAVSNLRANTTPPAKRSSPTLVAGILLLCGIAIGKWGDVPSMLPGEWTDSKATDSTPDPVPDNDTPTMPTLAEHPGAVKAMVFSADGRSLFSAGEDGTVRQWDVSSGQPVQTFENAGEVTSLDVSDDGWRLVAGGADGKVSFWDVHSGRRLRSIDAHEGPVESLDVSPDGRQLVTEGRDDRALLHDLVSEKSGAGLTDIDGDLLNVRFDSQTGVGRALVKAESGLQVWDIAAHRMVIAFPPETDAEFSADGRSVIAKSDAGETVHVYELDGARKPRTIRGLASLPRSVSLSPDGQRAAVVTENGDVSVWDLDTGNRVADLGDAAGTSTRVLFSPKGLLVLSDREHGVRLWRLGPDGAATQIARKFGRPMLSDRRR